MSNNSFHVQVNLFEIDILPCEAEDATDEPDPSVKIQSCNRFEGFSEIPEPLVFDFDLISNYNGSFSNNMMRRKS